MMLTSLPAAMVMEQPELPFLVHLNKRSLPYKHLGA